MKLLDGKKRKIVAAIAATAAIAVVTLALESSRVQSQSASPNAPSAKVPAPSAAASPSATSAAGSAGSAPGSTGATLDLTQGQLGTIKIGTVGSYAFPVDDDTVGSIDFDADQSVEVFPPYQGAIIDVLGELGSDVKKDQPLYTIKSPDLINAESSLIAGAASFDLTSKELKRAKDLMDANGVSVREMEQAVSDQQTADGALKAARDAVLVFGKTNAEIDQMIASRKTDPALVVRSPIDGKITAKNAQPGFFVQPGSGTAPFTVSDLSTKWMLANVVEADIPLYRLGQPVDATVLAYPGRVFKGTVSKIYATADPSTHRVIVRSAIADPNDELRPGMLADFSIRVKPSQEATALPANGVVREGDGTMTAWVTTDRRHFTQVVIKTGMRRNNQVQILAGLQRGQQAVTDGAIFLDNMLQAPAEE